MDDAITINQMEKVIEMTTGIKVAIVQDYSPKSETTSYELRMTAPSEEARSKKVWRELTTLWTAGQGLRGFSHPFNLLMAFGAFAFNQRKQINGLFPPAERHQAPRLHRGPGR